MLCTLRIIGAAYVLLASRRDIRRAQQRLSTQHLHQQFCPAAAAAARPPVSPEQHCKPSCPSAFHIAWRSPASGRHRRDALDPSPVFSSSRSFATPLRHTWYGCTLDPPLVRLLVPSQLTALCSVEGTHQASRPEKECCCRSRLCDRRWKGPKAAKGPESGVRDYEEEGGRRIGSHPDFKDHQRSDQRQSQEAV